MHLKHKKIYIQNLPNYPNFLITLPAHLNFVHLIF